MSPDEADALKVLERYRRTKLRAGETPQLDELRLELQREGFPDDDESLFLLLRVDWSFKHMLSELHRKAGPLGRS